MRKSLILFVSTFSILHVTFARSQGLPITPVPDGQICWDQELIEEPDQTFEEFIAEVQQGSGLYVNFRPDALAQQIGDYTYRVTPEEPIELLLQLYSTEAATQNIRYVVLLDEQQIDPFMNDQDDLFFDVALQTNTLNTFYLSIPPLDEGIHDVLLVETPNPNNPPEPDGTIELSHYRLTLIASEAFDQSVEMFAVEHELFAPTEVVRAETNTYNLTLALNNSTDPWTFPNPAHTLQSDQPLEFDVLAGYLRPSIPEGSGLEPPEVYRFALLFLINFQQVPYAEAEPVLYGAVPQNTAYTRIPVSLSVPQVSGIQELMVVKIDNPRVPMCVLRGPEGGYFLNQSLYSMRVAFEVVP